jgi:hypothetical protein
MAQTPSVTRALAAAAIVGSVLASGLWISISPVAAAIYTPQQALPASTIQQFLANPSAWLAQYPGGGPGLSQAVIDLVASDPQTLNAIIGLLASASPDQASAIGTGLGRVAEMVINSDPVFATQIQTAVVAAANNPAVVAFSAVVGGDIKLAAATGGVGPGGSGESQTGSNTPIGGINNSIPLAFPSSVNNVADSFSSPNFTPATPVSLTAP